MSLSERCLTRLRLIQPFFHARNQRRHCRRCFATTPSDDKWPQKIALGEYYESILNDRTLYRSAIKRSHENSDDRGAGNGLTPSSKTYSEDSKSVTALNTSVSFDTSPPAPPPSAPPPSSPPATAEEKVRIVFGSRILGPAEQEDRAAAKKARSTYIAGILVPPRPEEPDNCCMSGCVNCVWDRYGEDVEEWTAKKSEAEERLKQAAEVGKAGKAGKAKRPVDVATEKIVKDALEEDAFSSVPVGIREFIKMEKRLREKHDTEGTAEG